MVELSGLLPSSVEEFPLAVTWPAESWRLMVSGRWMGEHELDKEDLCVEARPKKTLDAGDPGVQAAAGYSSVL